jgi:hypothetical protein
LVIDRCAEEFHFNRDSEQIEFHEMHEGDETDLFWLGINEINRRRKYKSLLDGRDSLSNRYAIAFSS